MINYWHSLLFKAGFRVSLSEMMWGTTNPEEAGGIELDDVWANCDRGSGARMTHIITRLPRGVPFKVLGNCISMTNDASAEVQFRIQRAWAAFYKHRKILTNKACSLQKRLSTLQKFVLPALLYNIGSTHLSQSHLQNIRGAEDAMYRQIFRFRLTEAQSVDEYMASTQRTVNAFRAK